MKNAIIIPLMILIPQLVSTSNTNHNVGFPVKRTELDVATVTTAMLLEFIRREGIHKVVDANTLVAYKDPGTGAKPAIGIGHCRGKIEQRVTFARAYHLLLDDVDHFMEKVSATYPNLNVNQKLSISMLAHNIGFGAIGKELHTQLKNGDDPAALLKYIRVKGKPNKNLVTARAFEYALFHSDVQYLQESISINSRIENAKYKKYAEQSGVDAVSANLYQARIKGQILASHYCRDWTVKYSKSRK